MRIFLILLSFFLINIEAKVLKLDATVEQYNLVPYVEIYIDANNSTTIDDILKNKHSFEKNDADLLYYHFNTSTFWFHFSIDNENTQFQEYMLHIPTAWLDRVVLYSVNKEGGYTSQYSGDHVLTHEKTIKNRSIVFNVSPKFGVSEYYIQVNSSDALQIPIFLIQKDRFDENKDKLNLFFAFITGIIFMMLLYSFFYFVYLKDYLYGVYSGYILTFLAVVLSTHGYFLYYIYPDSFGFNEWIYSVSFVSYIGFMAWFTKEYLQVKSFSKPWNIVLRYIVIYHFVLVLLSPFLSYPFLMQVGIVSGMIVPFILIVPALYSLKYKNVWTRFYLVGWSVNMVFYTLWALSFFAILPYTLFLNNANSVGVLFELVILSLGMIYRVNTLMKSNTQLKDDVQTDPLTQVANRYAFNIEFPLRMKEAKAKGEKIFFAMLDIDNFKLYNDTYGHPKGDEVLKTVAYLVDSNLHRVCDKIYRLGGEEFALLICAENMDKALSLVEKIRKSIEDEKIMFSNIERKILTVSFGLLGVDSSLDIDELMIYKYADDLLYEAKKQGKNCVLSRDLGAL